MKIVCIGDSLTYGFGIGRNKTWPYLSEKKLGIEIINEGISGDTSGGMVSRFNNSVLSQKPDVVLIMGGTNDLIAGADVGIVKANIMSMVHQSLNKFIEPIVGIPTKIDLINVRDDWAAFTDYKRVSMQLEEYREWINKFSKTFNIKIIDFYLEIENMCNDKINELYIDGLHLNEQGQIVMADIFCEAIKKVKMTKQKYSN